MIQVVVYDLDDTLYPVRDYAFSGFDAVSNWLERNHFIGGFNPVIKEFYDKGVRGTLFNDSLEHMALSFDKQMIQDMIDVYRGHRPNISLLPEAHQVIEHFSANKKQSLITDGYHQVQKNKIDALDLDARLDYTLCTDSLGSEHWKPSPLAFRKTMGHFQLPGEAFIYVGDNPERDFLAPNNLGWQTVRIQRAGGDHFNDEAPNEQHAPKKTISSLSELLEII